MVPPFKIPKGTRVVVFPFYIRKSLPRIRVLCFLLYVQKGAPCFFREEENFSHKEANKSEIHP